ncbi:protein SHQ1 homolog [Watersipora subatra]|uniref:protein SHQ1 homolog n=1 Tax=Watersipora subatra TaxID=2589382 RepID=UPI00355B0D26
MLTPRFTLSQNDEFIIAKIETPYVKFSDGEMWMQDNEFSFYCKPYHLKLYFSGEIFEDGTELARYDVESGIFTINIPKMVKGEKFENLDMLTKLVTPSTANTSVKGSAVIEVLNSSTYDELVDETTEIDWSVEQVLPKEDEVDIGLSLCSCNYGFNLKHKTVFTKLREEAHELLDILNPEEAPVQQRPILQKQQEVKDFNLEHYIADFCDDSLIEELITYTSSSEIAYKKYREGTASLSNLIVYSKDEVEDLLRLPRKDYILDSGETKSALLGLIDVLFAYLYDMRSCMEENTVESCWTVRKLSSCLSWLVVHADLKTTLCGCLRRALSYPLYRHWVLAMKVLEDVCIALCLGRKHVVKCLLSIHRLFNNNEPYHVLNDLYITDYCTWIQTVSNDTLMSLSNQIRCCHLSKDDLGLDLLAVEESSSDDGSCDTEDDSEEDQEEMGVISCLGQSGAVSHSKLITELGDSCALVHETVTTDSLVSETVSTDTLVSETVTTDSQIGELVSCATNVTQSITSIAKASEAVTIGTPANDKVISDSLETLDGEGLDRKLAQLNVSD